MDLEELLKSSRPPKKEEITDRVLAKLFLKYKGLSKESEREKAYWSATHENINIAYAKLDERVEARTAELRKTNEQLRQEVTERKQAEEELEKHREHLEELVDERTKELKVMVNLMAGREVRMAELKDVLKQLRKQLEGARIVPVADDPLAGDMMAEEEIVSG